MIDEYLRILAEKEGVAFPEGYSEALNKCEGLRAALAAHPLPSRPGHMHLVGLGGDSLLSYILILRVSAWKKCHGI